MASIRVPTGSYGTPLHSAAPPDSRSTASGAVQEVLEVPRNGTSGAPDRAGAGARERAAYSSAVAWKASMSRPEGSAVGCSTFHCS